MGQASEQHSLQEKSVERILVVDGRPVPSLEYVFGEVTNGEKAVQAALTHLQEQGYYLATVDSLVKRGQGFEIHVTPGPVVRISTVQISGMNNLDSVSVSRDLQTRSGNVLHQEILEADIAFILDQYERAGYPLAEVILEDIELLTDDHPQLRVRISVNEGDVLRFDRIELVGGERTSDKFVERIAGLRNGMVLAPYQPDEILRRLEETGLFSEVGPLELALTHDMKAVLRIQVKEENPGSFDLVLGYLPAGAPGGGGAVTGNGHIMLKNLSGHGRELEFKLNRIPGQVSTLNFRASDPFIFGLPLRIDGGFDGHQQDSTFGTQRFRAEAGYRWGGGIETFVTLSREFTRPGAAGVSPLPGRTPVPRGDAWFGGLGIAFRRVDRPANPRHGFVLMTNLEQGRKSRQFLQVGDSEGEVPPPLRLRQQRFTMQGRVFLPVLERQVLAIGGDMSVLLGNEFDESDLFRVGGATSLRGYDEERFSGNVVARGLAEYRHQIDRLSYAFLFIDLGYIERPRIAEVEARRDIRPGYGIGIQYSTGIGLINVSYALNPEEGPSNGKVHVGLSVGL